MNERSQNDRSQQPPGEDPPLEERLGALFAGVEPPPELGDRLRAEAARRFGTAEALDPDVGDQRRSWRILRGPALPLTAAAAAALLVVAALRDGPDAPVESTHAMALAEAISPLDLDQGGSVDAYDAYLYARAVRTGDTEALPDLDGDGRPTRADAIRLAQQAVEVVR